MNFLLPTATQAKLSGKSKCVGTVFWNLSKCRPAFLCHPINVIFVAQIAKILFYFYGADIDQFVGIACIGMLYALQNGIQPTPPCGNSFPCTIVTYARLTSNFRYGLPSSEPQSETKGIPTGAQKSLAHFL